MVLLIPWLPDMVQKCFCTPDGAIYPTFQIKYIPRKFVFNLMEILIIKQIPLFLGTLYVKLLNTKNLHNT